MVDWLKDRTGTGAQSLQQNRNQENFSRNLAAFARDGKMVNVSFTAGDEVKVHHGLNRKPAGWFLMRVKGGGHSIVETSSNEKELRLQNLFASAVDIEAAIWVW